MKISNAIIAVLNFQAINYESLVQKECKSLVKTMSSQFSVCQAVHQGWVGNHHNVFQ